MIGLIVALAEGWQMIEPWVNKVALDKSLKKAAGCLIVEDHGVNGPLMLGVLTSVGEEEAERGKQEGQLVFGPPGGSFKKIDRDTVATAKRETLEETGYTVEISNNQPLVTFQNGNYAFDLFECSINRGIKLRRRDGEIQGLVWADPRGMEETAWRFASQRKKITALYSKLASDSVVR